jgi:hypothetical protein
VAGSHECGDEPSGSGTTDLVTITRKYYMQNNFSSYKKKEHANVRHQNTKRFHCYWYDIFKCLRNNNLFKLLYQNRYTSNSVTRLTLTSSTRKHGFTEDPEWN